MLDCLPSILCLLSLLSDKHPFEKAFTFCFIAWGQDWGGGGQGSHGPLPLAPSDKSDLSAERPTRFHTNCMPGPHASASGSLLNHSGSTMAGDWIPQLYWPGIKTIPKKTKCKKAKWLSEETLQITEKRSERQRRKGKIYPSECRVPQNSKER